MGTLKELIDYIESKSGVQYIIISENSKILFDGFTNSKELKRLYSKIVLKFEWTFRYSKILCIIGDELL